MTMMDGGSRNIDITKNIKAIEVLKSSILKDVALLYESMAQGVKEDSDISGVLARMVLNTYILSQRLGVGYAELDESVRNKLKLLALEEGEGLEDTAGLLKYLDSRRQNES